MTEQQTAQEFCREILGWEDAIFYTFRGKPMLLGRPLYEDGLPQPNGRRFYYTDLNQVMEAVQKFADNRNDTTFSILYDGKNFEVNFTINCGKFLVQGDIENLCQALMQAALEAKRRMK